MIRSLIQNVYQSHVSIRSNSQEGMDVKEI
jgi:hypothetical protein